MISPGDEEVRQATGPGFGEAVSFSWADPAGELFGSARVGLTAGPPAVASGLGMLFRGAQAAAAAAASGDVGEEFAWASAAAGPVTLETIEPLHRWHASLKTDEGGFDLVFEAAGPGVELTAEDSAVASFAGLEGYEHPCTVRGTAWVGGERLEVDGLGQRGRQWGSVPWKKIELARSVSAWFEPGRAVMLAALRPAGGAGHADEALTAHLIEPGSDGEDTEPAVVEIAEPRLSTVYDGEGRQKRAGMELWRDEDDGFARRIAGEAVCGTSLELGRLTLDAAFFRWRMEGRVGVGRYDVLRRA